MLKENGGEINEGNLSDKKAARKQPLFQMSQFISFISSRLMRRVLLPSAPTASLLFVSISSSPPSAISVSEGVSDSGGSGGGN